MGKWIALGALVALVLLFIFAPVVAWSLLGFVVVLLILLLLIPIGLDVSFIDGKFRAAFRVHGLAFQFYPKWWRTDKPPEEQKPKPAKKEEPKEPKPEKEQKPGKSRKFTKEEILEIIKRALKGLGKFGKLTVRKFMLHFVAAEVDPYYAAMIFSFVNASLSTLAPICRQTFNVKGDVDVWTDVDFTADLMRVDAELSITLRLIQVGRAALSAAIGVAGVLIQRKKRLREEAAIAKENTVSDPVMVEHTAPVNQVNNQSEERNDKNGDNNG